MTVEIQHKVGTTSIPAHAQNGIFLLTNKHGDYFSLGSPNTTNYNGYFVKKEDGYHKILYDIAPVADSSSNAELQTLVLNGTSVKRKYADSKQESYLFEQGLLSDLEGNFAITLDCKKLYDESEQGRMYSVERMNLKGLTVLTITYTKYTDSSLNNQQYRTYLSIVTDMDFVSQDSWKEVHYLYDQRRGTKITPWVYELGKLNGKGHMTLSTAQSPEDARRTALEIFAEKDNLVREYVISYQKSLPTLPPKELLTWRALESLHTRTGIMAGLPWFFQEWSRDELISVGGLLAARRYAEVISILDKWYGSISKDGTLPAIYPDKGLPSADASGWLGKRTRDLLIKLSDENLVHLLPKNALINWRDATGRIIDNCMIRLRDGLIWNEYNTTWMDTSYADDGRTGARIEIQALFLALFDAHAHLCTMTKTPVEKNRSRVAKEVLDTVHSKLFVSGMLMDGLHADGSLDTTTRPNMFIAWYVAPKLFSQIEWKIIFDCALAELWLSWGGLSSISVHDKNFHDMYTGEDVSSYHRGDSWYFVNNMAAQALFVVDPDVYKDCINHICAASMDDLLAQGFAGHASELSSAKLQEAAGCYSQAWSASTLLELQIKLRSTR